MTDYFETTPDDVVCENGCPDGMYGIHKMSCEWAGLWFHGDRHILILGASPDRQTVCVAFGEDEHLHLPAASLRHEVMW